MTDRPTEGIRPDDAPPDTEELPDAAAVVEELVHRPKALSPPTPGARPRRSTVLTAVAFVLVLALYLWVRPEPQRRAPEIGRVVQDAETGQIFVLPTTTAPPETTTTTEAPAAPASSSTSTSSSSTTSSSTSSTTSTTARPPGG